jgi:hypothetical protein
MAMVVRTSIRVGRSASAMPAWIALEMPARSVVTLLHLKHLPAAGCETTRHALGEGLRSRAIEGHIVRVVEAHQLAQAEVARKRDCLVGDTLHEVTVAGQGESAMFDDLATGSVEAMRQHSLSDRQPDDIRKALAQGPGSSFDARCEVYYRMSRRARPPLTEPLQVCDLHVRSIQVEQGVERARSGHPGLPLGAAPMAYVLFSRFLRHNPADPRWPNRDRFVLSAGHGSALLYGVDGQAADGVDA